MPQRLRPLEFAGGFVPPPTPRDKVAPGVVDMQNLCLAPGGTALAPFPGMWRVYQYALLGGEVALVNKGMREGGGGKRARFDAIVGADQVLLQEGYRLVSFPSIETMETGPGRGLALVDEVTGRVIDLCYHPGGVPLDMSSQAAWSPQALEQINRLNEYDYPSLLNFRENTHVASDMDSHRVFDGEDCRLAGMPQPLWPPRVSRVGGIVGEGLFVIKIAGAPDSYSHPAVTYNSNEILFYKDHTSMSGQDTDEFTDGRIDLTSVTYVTVSDVVDFINTKNYWSATLVDGEDGTTGLTLNTLGLGDVDARFALVNTEDGVTVESIVGPYWQPIFSEGLHRGKTQAMVVFDAADANDMVVWPNATALSDDPWLPRRNWGGEVGVSTYCSIVYRNVSWNKRNATCYINDSGVIPTNTQSVRLTMAMNVSAPGSRGLVWVSIYFDPLAAIGSGTPSLRGNRLYLVDRQVDFTLGTEFTFEIPQDKVPATPFSYESIGFRFTGLNSFEMGNLDLWAAAATEAPVLEIRHVVPEGTTTLSGSMSWNSRKIVLSVVVQTTERQWIESEPPGNGYWDYYPVVSTKVLEVDVEGRTVAAIAEEINDRSRWAATILGSADEVVRFSSGGTTNLAEMLAGVTLSAASGAHPNPLYNEDENDELGAGRYSGAWTAPGQAIDEFVAFHIAAMALQVVPAGEPLVPTFDPNKREAYRFAFSWYDKDHSYEGSVNNITLQDPLLQLAPGEGFNVDFAGVAYKRGITGWAGNVVPGRADYVRLYVSKSGWSPDEVYGSRQYRLLAEKAVPSPGFAGEMPDTFVLSENPDDLLANKTPYYDLVPSPRARLMVPDGERILLAGQRDYSVGAIKTEQNSRVVTALTAVTDGFGAETYVDWPEGMWASGYTLDPNRNPIWGPWLEGSQMRIGGAPDVYLIKQVMPGISDSVLSDFAGTLDTAWTQTGDGSFDAGATTVVYSRDVFSVEDPLIGQATATETEWVPVPGERYIVQCWVSSTGPYQITATLGGKAGPVWSPYLEPGEENTHWAIMTADTTGSFRIDIETPYPGIDVTFTHLTVHYFNQTRSREILLDRPVDETLAETTYTILGNPRRVWWTSQHAERGPDREMVHLANYLDLDMPGDEIQALARVGDWVLVVGRKHIAWLAQDATAIDAVAYAYPRPRMEPGPGTISGRTVVSVDGGSALWISSAGQLVQATTQGVQVLDITDRFRGYLSASQKVSLSEMRHAHAVYLPDRNWYVLCLPGAAKVGSGPRDDGDFGIWSQAAQPDWYLVDGNV